MKKIDYHKSVDYDTADPAKVLAQQQARATTKNLPFGFKEVEGTRGESAYVFDMGEMYGALVQEGLGTKSLIAQSIYRDTGKPFFASIAQDTVATFINDLVSVGATPVVANAYWSSSSYAWLADQKLTEDFIRGWRDACDAAGVVWGGGETQALAGIVEDGVLEFAGSAFGVIKPKSQLVSEKNLRAGDAILLVESSGVHANGISMTREIATQLPEGYQTKLPDGSIYGEVLLTPTHLYSRMVRELLAANVDIHYLSNITGHGWRKLMRASREFTYEIEEVPSVPAIFSFIAKQSGNDIKEMYGTFNMGVGYAIYLPKAEGAKAQAVVAELGLKSWIAGTVQPGPKQVVIKSLGITYEGSTLGVRE